MAGGRQDVTGGPELDSTRARQSRSSPGAFPMLVVSTIGAVALVALAWLFFAGPLHHAAKPQVQSPAQAGGFAEPAPDAKLSAPPTGENRQINPDSGKP